MVGAIERVDSRSAKQWAELFKQGDARQQLVLDVLGQGVVLRDEVVMEISCPRHPRSMHSKTYVVKDMLSLADLEGGILYVFQDDNQNLYRRTASFPGRMLEIPLQENLRNTQKISELTAKFYRGAPMRALGPEGQDVERIFIRDASEVERAVSRVLHHLITVIPVQCTTSCPWLDSSSASAGDRCR